MFDTIASLGAKGPLRLALGALVVLIVLAFAGIIVGIAQWLLEIRWTWSFLASAIGGWALWGYLRTALKIMRPALLGQRWPSVHLAQWSGKNFDRLLSKSDTYAVAPSPSTRTAPTSRA